MRLKYCWLLIAIGGLLNQGNQSLANTIFSDNFAGSTLNAAAPAAPTSSSTAYQVFSSKAWNPTPSIAVNDLRFGIGATSSGHIEVQALFASSPFGLTNVGDFVELTVTFTNTAGLFIEAGQLGFGLYNSGGVAPLAGGMNSTAVSGTAGVTGGAQDWQGYVSRIAYSGGTHRIATRPVQAITTGNNQDLITEGSGSQSYVGGVNLASTASTFAQAAAQLTGNFRITLTAANTLQIDSRLYSGANTNGTLLESQTAADVSGVNLLASSFDAFALGWRATSTNSATLIDIKSITVNSSLPDDNSGSVAGIYFQQPPGDCVAGATLSPAVTVVATNSTGLPVTNTAITLSLLTGTGPLNGTASQLTDASGVAVFNDLSLTSAGLKQLRASTAGVTADSAPFLVTNAAAAALVFTTQPSDALVSAVIAPPVVVQLRDVFGNDVASNVTVSISLTNGAGTLSGNTSIATDAAGKATFTNLSLNLAGPKQLSAVGAGFPTVLSSTFNITNLLIAFPGAEGAGASALGGRGGDVYYVTTLADSGAGSLRAGISGAPAGGRTILFKVSGNIVLNSTLTVNKPRITVAGQTAPGDGICFQNHSFNINANDVIIRHVRTRLGTNALAEADSMWIAGGTNVIVDHVSASWSVDETLSASGNTANLTVQWCYIAESLNNSIHSKGPHGYGSLITPGVNGTISWHHNLYAHNNSRNPRPGTDSGATVVFDFRNNAIYDYGSRAGYGSDWDPDPENLRMNYVANYIIAGPDSSYSYAFQGGGTNTYIYQATNLTDLNLNSVFDGVNNNFGMFSGTYTATNTAFVASPINTDSAAVALQRILALGGAMPWQRDAADQRIIGTVRHHNGRIIDAVAEVGTWPVLNSTAPPTDSDNDGMPDYWELAVGLNPNLSSDRNVIDVSGYTELEVYLNWLADAHALCDRNGQVDVDLRAATGGATNLSYSVANGANGTVSLLQDGYTAHFIAAANTNGVAGFKFTATDAANATTFGPVNFGVLITTTNAPVINTAPTLPAISNRTVTAGTLISFTNTAEDVDLPAQILTYSVQNEPAGASVNSSNGIFTWRPAINQSPSTNTLNVVVADNGAPSLSATQSFTINVLQPLPPILQSVSLTGGVFQLQVNGDAGPDYSIQTSTNLSNWIPLFSTNSPVLPFTWSDAGAGSYPLRFYRVLLGP